MLISGSNKGTIILHEDVWDDLGDGVMMRRYRKGQRISQQEAVEAGYTKHPDAPVAETLSEEKPEPRPAKKRKPKAADGDKARKPATVQDKARKHGEDKSG